MWDFSIEMIQANKSHTSPFLQSLVGGEGGGGGVYVCTYV